MLSSWRARILGIVGIAVLAVVGFGVYYLWFRDEPDPLTLKQIDQTTVPATFTGSVVVSGTHSPSASAAASSTAAASVAAGTTAFTIDAAKSEAAYFAGEKLASLPTNSVAKGTTKEIAGTFFLKKDGLDTTNASTLTVQMANLKSDQGMRDNRVRQTLETSKFPSATFTVTKLTGFPAELPTTGAGAAFTMTGILEVHGVKKEVTWDVTALRSGTTFSALAKVTVKYTDFGMTGPSIGGFVSVEENLRLEIQVIATAGG